MIKARILHYAIGPLGVAAISLITLPFLTWLFPESIVASYTLFFIVMNFGTMLFSLGLDQSLVRHYFSYEKKSLLLLTLLPGSFFVGSALIIISLYNINLSEILIGSENSNYAIIIGVLIAFYSRFLSLVLRSEDKALIYSITQLLPKLVLLIFLCFVFYQFFDANEESLYYAILFGMGGALFLQAFVCFPIIKNSSFSSLEYSDFKLNFKYGFPLLISSCAYYLLTISDRYFIKEILNLEELAYYSVAAHFAGAVYIIQSIFSTIWPTFIYKCYEKSSNDLYKLMIESVSRLLIVVIAYIWALIGVGSFLIGLVLPESYMSVVNVLPVLVAIPLISLLTEVTAVGINLEKKTYFHSIITILCLVINLIGNALLIPIMGIQGAAYATLISYLLYFVLKTETSIKLGIKVNRYVLYGVIGGLSLVTFLLGINDIEVARISTCWLLLIILFTLFNVKYKKVYFSIFMNLKKGKKYV